MEQTAFVFILILGVALSQKYIPTPGGYTWSECVHHVPDGSFIYDDEVTGAYVVYPTGERQDLPRCQYPRIPNKIGGQKNMDVDKAINAQGWQSWASFNTPDNSTFTQFLGNFSVPTVPPKWSPRDEAIIYLFTGLQNDNWIPTPSAPSTPPGFDIIQPVLQYGGDSAGGGGEYWAVASWYVTVDDSFVVSTLKQVKPGQIIFGNMTKVGSDIWFIGSEITGTGVTTNINVQRPRLASQPWAYCTLEIYNIDECTWLPTTPIQFTGLSLLGSDSTPITPTWQTYSPSDSNPCNTKASVISASAVEIQFSS